MQTIRERFGELQGLKLTFVGDGNNVAHSLMLTALRLGMNFALACPEGYNPNPEIVAQAEGLAAVSGASLLITHDPARPLRRRRTRSTPMCGPAWARSRRPPSASRAFRDYQVNDELFALARPDAVFMHCLPAKRGEEVTDSIMETARSVVFDQAENRLHAQKALLLMLLAEPRS